MIKKVIHHLRGMFCVIDQVTYLHAYSLQRHYFPFLHVNTHHKILKGTTQTVNSLEPVFGYAVVVLILESLPTRLTMKR